MFKTTIPEDISLQYSGDSFVAPKAASLYDLYQLGLRPDDVQTNDVPVSGSVLTDMYALQDAAPNPEIQKMSDRFDYERSGADMYKSSDNFSAIGYNPFGGVSKDYETGKTFNPYQVRYQQAQTWGDVLSNAAGQFAGLTWQTIKTGAKADYNLFNALLTTSSWFASGEDSFMSKLAGTPEDLAETDREVKALMNKYAIYQSPETEEGIFNKEFLGTMIGQLGFSVGSIGYMVGSSLLLEGVGRLAGAGKTAAAMTRVGKAMENIKNTANAADMARMTTIVNDAKNTGKWADAIIELKKLTDVGKDRNFITSTANQLKRLIPLYDAIGDYRAAGIAGATRSQQLQASVPGLIKAYTAFSGARAEAMMEAAGTYNDMYSNLLYDFYDREKREPTEAERKRIQNAAYGAATDNFIVNTGLLMTMNQLEMPNLFGKFSSSKRLYRELAENLDEEGLRTVTGKLKTGTTATKVYEPSRFGGIGMFNQVRKDFGLGTALYATGKEWAKKTGKFEILEGVQEILQEGSNKALTDYYTAQYNGNTDIDGNILHTVTNTDWKESLTGQLNKEGWKTFLMGAATGLFLSPLTSAISYGRDKGAMALSSEYKDQVNANEIIKAENRKLIKAFFDSPETVLAKNSRFKAQAKAALNMQEATVANDPYSFHNTKDDAIAQLASAAIKTGTLESVVDSIKTMADGRFTDEEFMQQFGLTEKVNQTAYANEIANNIESYYTNWKNMKDMFADLVLPEMHKDEDDRRTAQIRKAALNEAIDILAYNSQHAENAVKRTQEIKNALSQVPGVGSASAQLLNFLSDATVLEDEIRLQKDNIKTLTGIEGPEVAENKKQAEEKVRFYEQWKSVLESISEGKEIDNPLVLELFRATVASLNKANKNNNATISDIDVKKAYSLLGDYMALTRDYSHYVQALNTLSDPNNFILLHRKLTASMKKAVESVEADANKEADTRSDVTTGNPVPEEDLPPTDTDTDNDTDTDIDEEPEPEDTTTPVPVFKTVDQPTNKKIQNINNMNIIQLAGDRKAIDSVLASMTTEQIQDALRIVSYPATDKIEQVPVEGGIRLIDNRRTDKGPIDLGVFPEDKVPTKIAELLAPFDKNDYTQQLRSTWFVEVYIGDVFVGYLAPEQQYLFNFNNTVIPIEALTPEQFAAVAVIPDEMTVEQALQQFKTNVARNKDIWTALEGNLGTTLTGTEVPFSIVSTVGSFDFIKEKDSLENVRPTVNELDGEVAGIYRTDKGQLLFGDSNIYSTLPTYADQLGNYKVAVKLGNGSIVWLQTKGQKYTNSEFSSIYTKIKNAYTKDIKENTRNSTNEKLPTIFVTTRPELANSVFFNVFINQKGNLTVTWYNEAMQASGVVDVFTGSNLPFTNNLESFANYLTSVINPAMRSKKTKDQGIDWPEEDVIITEYNIRKNPTEQEIGDLEVTVNPNIVKNLVPVIVPFEAISNRQTAIEPQVEINNLPEEVTPNAVPENIAIPQPIVQETTTDNIVNTLTNIEDLDDLFDTAVNTALKVLPSTGFSGMSVENIDKFKDYLLENLPDWLTLEEVDSFVDTLNSNYITVGEFAYYLDAVNKPVAIIRTSKDAAFKYHEAFHMVFRLLLPQSQIDTLLNEVAKVKPVTEEALTELRNSHAMYAGMSKDELIQVYYEEVLADMFEDFRMNRSTRATTGIKGFFNKLVDWFNWLFAQFTGSEIKALFYEIDRGSFKNTVLQDNQFTQSLDVNTRVAKKLIQCGVTLAGTDNITEVPRYLSQQKADNLVNTITAQFLQYVLTAGEYNTDRVLNGILSNYGATYQPNQDKYREQFKQIAKVDKEAAIRWLQGLKDLHSVFTTGIGKDQLVKYVKDQLSLLDINTEMEEDEVESLIDDTGDRVYADRPRPSTYNSLSKFLRTFISSTTTVVGEDEYGNKQFADGTQLVQALNTTRVYNGMIKMLSNMSTGTDMLAKMWSMRNEPSIPETAAFIRSIIDETGMVYDETTGTIKATKNEILIQQTIKGFNLFEVDHFFVQIDNRNNVRIFSANAAEATQNQLNTWVPVYEAALYNKLIGKNKKEIKELTKDATLAFSLFTSQIGIDKAKNTTIETVTLENLSREIATKIQQHTGIKLAPKYIEYSIVAGKNPNARTKEQQILHTGYANVEPITVEIIDGITTSILKGENIFQETETSKGAVARLKVLALGNGQFDESVNTTSYQSADGETVYSHAQPSFITVTTNKLNNENFVASLRQDPDKYSFLLDSPYFMELVKQRKLKAINADGLKKVGAFKETQVDEEGRVKTLEEGIVMGDFSPREVLVYLFSMYAKQKNKVQITTPGTEEGVKSFKTVPVMLRTVEAKNQMYFTELPIIYSVVNGSLSQEAIDIMYGLVLQEQERIRRIREEIKIIERQQKEVVKPGEKRQEVITDVHNGKLRGLKLFNVAAMVGDMAADIEAGKPIDKEALTAQLDKYWEQETNNLIKDMQDLQLIQIDETGAISNLTAPAYLFEGFSDTTYEDTNIIADNFRHNVMQVFINDYLNTAGMNRLLLGEEALSFKDTIDQVKRASGWAAAGPDMRVFVPSPSFGINHTLMHFHHVTYKSNRFKKMSDTDEATGDKDDAQMYMTEKALRYALFGFGTLNKGQVYALDTLQDRPLTEEEMFEEDGLVKAGAFNSLKLVYFDGTNYLKNSSITLFKTFTSLPDASGEYTIPFPGREELHDLRLKLEGFEERNQTICFAHPKTASKGRVVNMVESVSSITDNSFQQLDAQYMRKQVENPSNKKVITAPTQSIIQIMAEQDLDTPVVFLGSERDASGKIWTVGRIRDIYEQSIAQRKRNSFDVALNDIVDFQGAVDELSAAMAEGKVTPKMERFIKNAQEMLMATGADSQTLGFFELDEQGNPLYDLNFPSVLTKYTQLFLNYFSKGILSEKVPGMSVATVSSYGIRKVKVVESIWKEGDKGYVPELKGQPKTWKVVTDAEIMADPVTYSRPKDWDSNKGIYNRLYIGLQVGDIIVDDLRHNYPKYDKDGNFLGYFSEALIPAHHRDVMSKIPEAYRFLFGIRIPSDDKHSYVAIEWVDTLPAQYGSVGVFPQEIVEISGMDFDIDKVYIEMMDTYLNSEEVRVAYGTATTNEGMYNEYLNWQFANNKPFKAMYRSKIEKDEDVRAITERVKELRKYREDLSTEWEDLNIFSVIKKLAGPIRNRIITQQGIVNAELKDLQDILEDIRVAYIRQSLRELNLPATLEDFIEAGTTDNNNGVLTNKALSAKLAMLNNEFIAGRTPRDAKAIINQGTSVDILSGLVEEFTNLFTGMLNDTNVPDSDKKNLPAVLGMLKESTANVDSLRGKWQSNGNNKEGSRNIGPAVVSMLTFSVMNKYNKKVTDPYKIVIDNKTYYHFGTTLTSDGNRKFAQISAIVNAMTDNAKERLAAKLGLNINAVGHLATIVAMGVPIKTATLLLLQPSVREYYRLISAASNSLKTETEKTIYTSRIFEDLQRKYSIGVKKEDKGFLSENKMYKNIASGNYNNNAVNLQALKELGKIDGIAKQLQALSRVMSLQKGLPTTWEEVDDITNTVSSLAPIIPPMMPPPIELADVVTSDPIIATNVDILNRINDVAPLFFTERNTGFKNVTSAVFDNFMPRDNASKERFLKTVKNDLLSFLSIQQYMQDMAGKPEYLETLRHSLIYPTTGEKSIVGIVKEGRELISTQAIGKNRKNLLLTQLLAVEESITGTGINEVRANNWVKLSDGFTDSLVTSMIDLYANSYRDRHNRPINTKPVAIALFHYLLVKDGGQFKNNSFIRWIPNLMFLDLANAGKRSAGLLSTNRQKVTKQFFESVAEHVNNINNVQVVKPIEPILEGFVSMVGMNLNVKLNDPGDLKTLGKFTINEDGTLSFPPYVKVQLETSTRLYKRVSVNGSERISTNIEFGVEAQYEYVPVRGSKATSMMTGVFGQVPVVVRKNNVTPINIITEIPTTTGTKEVIEDYKAVIGGVRYSVMSDGTKIEIPFDSTSEYYEGEVPNSEVDSSTVTYDDFYNTTDSERFKEVYNIVYDIINGMPVGLVKSNKLEDIVRNLFNYNTNLLTNYTQREWVNKAIKDIERYIHEMDTIIYAAENPVSIDTTPQTEPIQIGSYVTYQDTTYIVTQQNSNGTWQIYNPLLEGAAAKKSVSANNLVPGTVKARIVTYKNANYIVTPKGTIISLTSNKKMNWADNNGNRLAILELANVPPSQVPGTTIVQPKGLPAIDITNQKNCG
jgi:hypothetical protein